MWGNEGKIAWLYFNGQRWNAGWSGVKMWWAFYKWTEVVIRSQIYQAILDIGKGDIEQFIIVSTSSQAREVSDENWWGYRKKQVLNKGGPAFFSCLVRRTLGTGLATAPKDAASASYENEVRCNILGQSWPLNIENAWIVALPVISDHYRENPYETAWFFL